MIGVFITDLNMKSVTYSFVCAMLKCGYEKIDCKKSHWKMTSIGKDKRRDLIWRELYW